MPTFSSDLAGFARAMSRFADTLPEGTDDAVQRLTLIGLGRVKLAASGRPGPRRVTGDYTRSMNAQFTRGDGGIVGTIGTNAVQAMRLEYGFHGQDSLGRRYRQPALPHWRPTYESLIGTADQLLPRIVEQAIGRAFGA